MPEYICDECGESFPRFELITRVKHRWIEHPDSLQRHLLENSGCMDTYAEKAEAKYDALKAEDDPWADAGDDCVPTNDGGYWHDPNDPTA
jgi:hypothetical protein